MAHRRMKANACKKSGYSKVRDIDLPSGARDQPYGIKSKSRLPVFDERDMLAPPINYISGRVALFRCDVREIELARSRKLRDRVHAERKIAHERPLSTGRPLN